MSAISTNPNNGLTTEFKTQKKGIFNKFCKVFSKLKTSIKKQTSTPKQVPSRLDLEEKKDIKDALKKQIKTLEKGIKELKKEKNKEIAELNDKIFAMTVYGGVFIYDNGDASEGNHKARKGLRYTQREINAQIEKFTKKRDELEDKTLEDIHLTKLIRLLKEELSVLKNEDLRPTIISGLKQKLKEHKTQLKNRDFAPFKELLALSKIRQASLEDKSRRDNFSSDASIPTYAQAQEMQDQQIREIEANKDSKLPTYEEFLQSSQEHIQKA